jgi:hypothetical protein
LKWKKTVGYPQNFFPPAPQSWILNMFQYEYSEIKEEAEVEAAAVQRDKSF